MATIPFHFLASVLGIFLSGHLISSSSAERAGTIIPLYVWPMEEGGRHSWQALIDAKAANPQVTVYAIVNPQNGPGPYQYSEYVDGLRRLRDAGIKTIGYVLTNYGSRPEATVQADINTWLDFYPNSLDGIFFDEMAHEGTDAVGYYRSLSNFAKGKGLSFTVGNPGTDTKPEFVGSVDTIIIFETNTGFPANDKLDGWHTGHSKDNWGIMPYNIGQLSETDVRNAKQFVRYIFVHNDELPNPWDTLPPYLNQLFRVLNEE